MTNPAETYESYMVPVLFRPAAQRLVELSGVQGRERVLDVGCGTGIVARTVAAMPDREGSVAGLDASEAMLAVARSSAASEGLEIDWHEGPAERMPFDDGAFDLVLCQFALMFFSDRPRALAEMRRVLAGKANGARVGIAVFQPIARHPFYELLHDAIGRRLGASGVADIFSLGDEGGLRRLVEGAGFTSVKLIPYSMTARFPQPEAFLRGEIDVDTAAIPSMQHLDADARAQVTAGLAEEMREALGKLTRDDHVEMPFHVQVVIGEV